MIKILLLSFLFSCASLAMENSTLKNIIERKQLRVGTTFDYAPFTYKDSSGNPKGRDIEMANSLAKSLNVKIIFVQTTWKNLIKDLRDHKFDIAMGGISIKEERKKHALFSIPYLNNGKLPIARCKDKQKYKTLDSINNPRTKVIVNPGGTNEKFANKFLNQAKIILHADNNTIFKQIIMGNADVMVTDSAEVYYQAEKSNHQLCPTMTTTLTNESLGHLMPKDTKWKEYVDSWLTKYLRVNSL